MKKFLFMTLSLIVCASAPLAQAQEVITFSRGVFEGWTVGDASSTEYAENVRVSFTIDSSPNSGQMYVRAEFCSTGNDWEGGIRVTTSYPNEAHATLRLSANECSEWAEHLEEGADPIYIYINERG